MPDNLTDGVSGQARALSAPVSAESDPKGGRFPIVGIGASAGGLAAVSKLLENLPNESGMAFVYIQHLDPSHKTDLPALLSQLTKMPVNRAEEGSVLQPNHVYVIPENAVMILDSGVLHLRPRDKGTPAESSIIDEFFVSLALDMQDLAVGVILSGNGSDGCLGLKSVKQSGGITFAQDELSAKFPEMPLSALRSGVVDSVLTPEGIAGELGAIARNMDLRRARAQKPELTDLNDHDYSRVMTLLRKGAGIDFSDYRDNTIRRRLARRLALRHMDSLEDYVRYLEKNRTEVEALCRDILINVTSFFRDPEVFEALKGTVFPRIVQGKSLETPVRIWVPGCSSGQEVYSIAIALLEYMDSMAIRPPIQIFGTDLSDAVAIERARSGFYPTSVASEISPERLSRFFTKEDHGYRIARNIRDICIFAKQNVAVDPPFSRIDLISCRNLLIYLSNTLQKRVIPSFHYSLNTDGFLLLGSSETVGRFTDLFQVVDGKHRIHSKIPTVTRSYPHFMPVASGPTPKLSNPVVERPPSAVDLQKEADRVLLNRFAPAGVLVAEDLEVLQFRGRTGAYLEPAPGEASFNLLRMARENLFSPIRSAVDEARASLKPVKKSGVRFRDGSELKDVNIEVIPVKLPGSSQGGYLILFEPVTAMEGGPAREMSPRLDAIDGGEIEQLRQDLANAKEYLQSIIEQQAASNEELRSANEEVLSSNEELQSANEELQTSKEELQSTNEEITTVNEELNNRNQELARANDDLVNLLSSVKIPIVIFGTDLCIRRFTPAAGKTLGLIAADVGRSISSIRLPLTLPHIEDLIAEVIANVTVKENEVQDTSGHWYLLRLHPYRTADNRIDGAVAVLMDIEEVRFAREVLRETRDYAMSIVNTMSQPLVILNSDLRVVTLNNAFEAMFHVSLKDCLNVPFLEMSQGQWNAPVLRGLFSDILEKGTTFVGFQIEHDFADLGRRVLLLNARRMNNPGPSNEILIAFEDVTERQKQTLLNEARLEEVIAANAAKDQFLAALSHELRTPLTPVLLTASALEQSVNLSEEVRQQIQLIRRNVELEAQLIDDLLDLTRARKGKLSVKLLSSNVCALIEQSIEIVQCRAQTKGVAIRFVDDAVNCQVLADKRRLKQVFWNLLNNGVKFSRTGSEVLVHVTNIGEDVLRIEFKDQGIGVPVDQQGRIFNAFEQGDHEVVGRSGGLGLGLAIAKAITVLHKGSIRVESEGVDKGANFIVELPTVNLCLRPNSALLPDEAPTLGRSEKVRLLVVEDHLDTASVIVKLLQAKGYDVWAVHSIAEAQRAASELSFDLLISDIGLPDGSGVEVLRLVREVSDIPGIALTGYGTERDRYRILESGFAEFLVKPIDFAKLNAAIVRVLSTHA
ncbi:MAG: chemotaxis protein CheB [Verrucomicrobiota bacterium]